MTAHLGENYNNKPEFKLKELLDEGEYYDQAHFIKEFKKLVGETPSRYFKRSYASVK